MAYIGLFVLYGLSGVFFPCKGQVLPPPGGNSLIVLSGSTVKIEWRLDPPGLSTTNVIRSWSFKSSRSGKGEFLAEISRAGTLTISTKLYEVDIEEPATLVLKNVNARYDGKYVFTFLQSLPKISVVDVTIAAKPNVMLINCSTTVNEGDDFTCECRDEDGIPRAKLIWYDKYRNQTGKTSYKEIVLTVTNVTKHDSGRYTCKAQSYILEDEKSFELIVHYEPTNTTIHIPKEAYIGETLAILCESDGLPVPNYAITHNGTIVSNEKKHIKGNVQYNDTGTYKCTAMNVLGKNSDSGNLTVIKGPIFTPSASSTSLSASWNITRNGTVGTPAGKSSGTNSGLIVGIITGVLAFLVIIAGIVLYCYKSNKKDWKWCTSNGTAVPVDHYLFEPVPGGDEESSSKSNPPAGNTLPPAAVDKHNRQGNTLYASLDTDAMQSSRASKKEPDRPPQTEYASIDFGKSAPKADLV